MSRCQQEEVFYRVIFTTLLAIALIFTVILTNVFFDIDAFVTSRVNAFEDSSAVAEDEDSKVSYLPVSLPATHDAKDSAFEELEGTGYRRKRSLDAEKFIIYNRNPKIKNILTNRLMTILEQLETGESLANNGKYTEKEKSKTEDNEKYTKKENRNLNTEDKPNVKDEKRNEGKNIADKNLDKEWMELAMQSIFLHDILGHIDFNLNKKKHLLDRKDHDDHSNKKDESEKSMDVKSVASDKTKESNYIESIDSKFVKEVVENMASDNKILREVSKQIVESVNKGPKLSIKAVINITTNKEDQVQINNKTETIDTIKVIYNDKSYNFTRTDKKLNVEPTIIPTTLKNKEDTAKEALTTKTEDNNHIVVLYPFGHKSSRKSFLDKVVAEYIQNHSNIDSNDSGSSKETQTKHQPKRYKRNIRVRYDEKRHKEKKRRRKKHENKLIFEIEMHYDNSGMNRKQEKKLVQDIVDRIQKAIDTEMHQKTKKQNLGRLGSFDINQNSQKKYSKSEEENNKISSQQFNVLHNSAYVSSPINLSDSVSEADDKSSDSIKQIDLNPKLIPVSESVSSTKDEKGDMEHEKAIDIYNIPQRLQQPLISKSSNEVEGANMYTNFGNVRFIIRSIDGDGVSIGLNQYLDQSQDIESNKKTYNINNNSIENKHNLNKRSAVK